MTSETSNEKKNSDPENPTVPLVLSLIACLCFALSIIAAGYVHGHMSISAVFKNLGWYINAMGENSMKVVLDNYEKEILIETIEFRLENDDRLILDDRMRDDIKDILQKVEDEYL